jgi:choline dehydrogenase-like flavoprotein
MWYSGLDAKLLQLRYGHMINFIALTRDRDTGEVFPDPETGAPRMVYNVSEFDRENAMAGVQALAKLCYVAGAHEIRALIAGVAPFRRQPRKGEGEQSPLDNGKSVKDPQLEDPKFAAWLLEVRQAGNQAPEAVWSSAHQMGTCRMGVTAEEGVVDQMGKVWGHEGLYVADSSVMPSASGVNPMITTLALADWISRGLVKAMGA